MKKPFIIASLFAISATQAQSPGDLQDGTLYECPAPCNIVWAFPTHKWDGITPLPITQIRQTYLDWGFCPLNVPNRMLVGLHRRRILQAPENTFTFPDTELLAGQTWCVKIFCLQTDGYPTAILEFRLMVPTGSANANKVGKPPVLQIPSQSTP